MVQVAGDMRPTGQVKLKVIKGGPKRLTFGDVFRFGLPQSDQSDEVNEWRTKNLVNLQRGFRKVVSARALRRLVSFPLLEGTLFGKIIRANGQEVNLGLMSMRVVTTTGVGFIVDAFQNLVELENMKFHGIGTGSVAEAVGDTALGTELTTQYNPDNTRATGSTIEAAANIYRTVGTNTVDAAVAITEHGILSQAATGGGVLLDRSVFSVVNLANGDSLQTTYDFTVNSGG